MSGSGLEDERARVRSRRETFAFLLNFTREVSGQMAATVLVSGSALLLPQKQGVSMSTDLLQPSNVAGVAFDVVEAVTFVRGVRKDGAVATLAPMVARRGVEATVGAVAGAAASAIAYAGVGGTLLQAGVALGVCSTPLIVAAAPCVAIAAGVLAANAVRRRVKRS